MYTLYYYPRNASLAPHLILKELGVEFELVLVDRKIEAQKSANYLALNPAGRIPTLVDAELVLFESPAICLHLCEKHSERALMPATGDAARPLFFQWMMYLTNTLQAELMVFHYPEKHTTDGTATDSIVAAQDSRIADSLSLLDAELADKMFLVGESLTACDYFLFMLALWAQPTSKPPLAYPNLGRYLKVLAQRPAVIAVCEKEGIDLSPFVS